MAGRKDGGPMRGQGESAQSVERGRPGPSAPTGDTSSAAAAAPSPQGEGKGRRRELTCVSFVIMPDGRTVPVGELTEEEREQWRAHMRERLSAELGAYYTQHPEEYKRLKGREEA